MPNPSRTQVDDAIRFDTIKELLFYELVLNKIGKIDSRKTSNDPWLFIKIEPTSSSCPMLIGRSDKKGCKNWDNSSVELNDNVDMRFIDYFDWDEFGFIDFQYIRVRILSSEKHSHLIGKEALIETRYARVFFEELSSPRQP
jgi:hypothetical protein